MEQIDTCPICGNGVDTSDEFVWCKVCDWESSVNE